MKTKWLGVLVLGLAMLLASGCELTKDPKSLMSVPHLPAEKENLKGLIMSALPEGASIIRPRNVKDTSAIRMRDLNQDGVKEAIVFYSTPEQDVRIHGMIWEYSKETWTIKMEFDGEGTDLDSFELLDLTNDGNIELIVGYANGDQEVQKGLVVYSYQNNQLEKLLEKPYTSYVVNDLDDDGSNELTIVTLKPNQTSTITSMRYSEGKFKDIGSLTLDPFVNTYYNVVAGEAAPGRKAVFIDAMVGAHSAYTDVVVLENNQLRKVVSDQQTYKPQPVPSQDINGDGIIEIGMMETPKGWEHVNLPDMLWFHSFYQWDGADGLKFIALQYRDPYERFYFNFPSDWRNRVTLDIRSKQGEHLHFVDVDTNETLAEIEFFPTGKWEANKKGWKELSRSEDKVIAFRSKYELTAKKSKLEMELPKSNKESGDRP